MDLQFRLPPIHSSTNPILFFATSPFRGWHRLSGCGRITGALVSRKGVRTWEAHIFTSRFAPGIQICWGRGSLEVCQSIALSTASRILANHQLARAMRPSRLTETIFNGRPSKPSSSCSLVALFVVIIEPFMRNILTGGVGQRLSK